MKALVTLATLWTMMAGNVHADVFNPDGVITKIAKMEKKESRYGFNNIEDIQLYMTRSDDFDMKNLILTYVRPGTEKTMDQPVIYVKHVAQISTQDTHRDSCGSTHIYARVEMSRQLPLDSEETVGIAPSVGGGGIFGRFNIHLVDHSTRNCRDFQPFTWVAEVRQGYGFCGTMDATMKIVGNPVLVPELME